MILISPVKTCAKTVFHLSSHFQKQMRGHICNIASPTSSSSFLKQGNSRTRYSCISIPSTFSCLSDCGFPAFLGIHYGSGVSSKYCPLTVKSSASPKGFQETLIDFSSWHNASVRILVPRRGLPSTFKCNVETFSWSKGYFATSLISGMLVCYSTFDSVHAETTEEKGVMKDFSHGKKVYTDYSVIGIPGDGRCLFCSVAHGACLRSGKPPPSERLQKELADELRAMVADEFIRRRQETEWFIEGDFDSYVSQIRKPHVWGGEPELLMLSHVLRMPITVYMHDEKYGGLISIAEYGQEYGKDNPIRVLYHGFGHYDALLIPGKKGVKSRL